MTDERTIDGSIGHQSFGHQPFIHRFIAGRPKRDAVSVMCERAHAPLNLIALVFSPMPLPEHGEVKLPLG